MLKQIIFTILAVLFWTTNASAQFNFRQDAPVGGPRLGKSQNQTWRAGIVIEPGASVQNIQVTIPVPMEWYEQRIININEEKIDADLASRIEYRNLGGAMEMCLRLRSTSPTKPIEVVVAVELQNFELLPPENTEQYVIPTQSRILQEFRPYLRPSQTIESDDPVFARMFAEITRNRNTDWDKIEAVYSFVQNNVKYDETAWNKPAKGALAVTKMPRGEWSGDCKDMTCLFVALCRAGKIPTRVVRVPEHCYAEFYLVMKPEGRANNNPVGFWFPCQVSGTYSFGGIPEKRVILQKGDSFPDRNNPGRSKLFLVEAFNGQKVSGTPDPKYHWVREAVLK